MDLLCEVLKNLLVNLITFIILLLVSIALYSWTRRRRIRNLFNLKKSDKLVIYVPVFTPENKLVRTEAGIVGNFDSLAVSYSEFNAAASFRERFKFILPPLSDQPGFFNKLFISDIHIDIHSASYPVIQETSLISIGGTALNPVSSYIEERQHSRVKFVDGKIKVPNIPAMGDGYTGFIQKITDKNRSLFYVAGPSTLGSAAALSYLSKNWDNLEKKYDDHDFLVVLQFENFSGSVEDVIYEKDLSK